jgi:acyl-CoA synthetase (NDP forming)
MPETGAKVLASMGRYAALRGRPAEPPVALTDVDAARARSILAAGRAGKPVLGAGAGFDLLTCYGIPVARYASAANVDECLAAADKIGYPIVLKVDAEAVVHKTESGGVVLDIRDRDSLREQAERLAVRFAETLSRFLVQEQLAGGREVIIGAKAVEGLGHVVMFGLGGIYVEVLQDASFKITPVNRREAREMIESIAAYPLLAGARGQAGVDVAALAEIIQRVSQMLHDNPEIRELDINPVFAFEHGAKAADVRVML